MPALLISSAGTLPERFARLADAWHDRVDGESAGDRIVSAPEYLSIIAMGAEAVPLILQDLQSRGGFWYPALLAITNEWPMPESANGIPRLMKSAWLEWGRKNGYVEAGGAAPSGA